MQDARPRILVTIDMAHLPRARGILESAGDVTYLDVPPMETLLRHVAEADALVTNLRQVIGPEALDAAPRLKVIATPSTGTDHIDLAYAESKGIQVQSLKRDYDVLRKVPATAELAFTLMLCCLRRLPFAFDAVKRGEWDAAAFRGREAEGRVVGVIGYGRLGTIFARLARGFGMKVIACDPHKTVSDAWVEQVKLDDLLQRAEIITVHVHLSLATEGLIGAREFAQMRDGVYFVNTSRGKLLDEAAFLRNLESGKIACAGVDVLANELAGDVGNDALVAYARSHSNLIITPHMGGATFDSQEKAFCHAARKLADFLSGAR